MSSHKSTDKIRPALEPKRQRGRRRVAAIIEAAAAVFAEEGYDAATMTEIAARASTAIGSLYRFFPSKEALAEALLVRYRDAAVRALEDLAAIAPTLSPGALADALVDLMLELQADRAIAITLVDARRDGSEMRSLLRETMRRDVADVLSRAITALPPTRAATLAVIVLHVLKAVPALSREPGGAALVKEVRELIRLLLSSLQDPDTRVGEVRSRRAGRQPSRR